MKLFNRVKFATSTTGTGNIAVGSAESGFLTPAVAGVSNGDKFPYFIEDGGNFAHGEGTYSTTGPTLTRDSGEMSWNGSSYAAAKLSLSGSAKVFCAQRARDMFRLTSGAGLTIAGGAITVTHNYHVIDTEGGAGTDNLDTINGGVEGQIVVLHIADSARDVVVRDGAGNIFLNGGADFSMDTWNDTLTLMYITNPTSRWLEIGRSDWAV